MKRLIWYIVFRWWMRRQMEKLGRGEKLSADTLKALNILINYGIKEDLVL